RTSFPVSPSYPLRTSSPTAIDFEGNWYRALRTAGPGSSFLHRPSLPFNSSDRHPSDRTIPSAPIFTPDVQVTVLVVVTVAEHITPRRQRATSNYTYSVRPSRASVTQC
ncbi:Uncharacterized protein FWK35_00002634, partial [Aphis craccivora]